METSEYKPFHPDVHDYVDGRMSAEAEGEFERRLGRDAELKLQVDALKRTVTLLHGLPVHEPKPGFDERVIGRIREEDLADRARARITAAPTPLWQNIVQVGLGAAAAAVVLVVIGVPGIFKDNTDAISGSGGEVARVAPTEEDLLPALADHSARFESLRRNVTHTKLADPRLQRQAVAMELQYSDLLRRNGWLSEQVAELSTARRSMYQDYLSQIDVALNAINAEVNDSMVGDRAMNLGLVDARLAAVRAPAVPLEKYLIASNTGELLPDQGIEKAATPGELSEVALYSLVRLADYRHDHAAVIDAADTYLKFCSAGYFKDQANATAIAAHLRNGQDVLAARRFAAAFGDYDEDLKPGQLDVVRGLMSGDEFTRLNAARKALRE